jgi:hypothetical protein
MSESFGARLRQRREQQHIALATISEQTKIKVSLLEGLERDDISHWPLGIFRRAFIRSYANAIGLEPNAVLQEFLALHPDVDALPVEPLDALADSVGVRARPPTRLRFLVGSAIGSLSLGRVAAADKRVETIAIELSDAVTDVRVEVEDRRSEINEPCVEAVEDRRVEVVESQHRDPVDDAGDEWVADAPSVVGAPTTLPAFAPDLMSVARVCTELSRADTTGAVESLLGEAARILDAAGLIVWIWDPQAPGLRPAMACGYPSKLLAQLPAVARDADNATAAAFRTARTCLVRGSDQANGAAVVPLMTPSGCAGALAVELKDGREQTDSVQALATIIAAQLARLIPEERSAQASDRKLA